MASISAPASSVNIAGTFGPWPVGSRSTDETGLLERAGFFLPASTAHPATDAGLCLLAEEHLLG